MATAKKTATKSAAGTATKTTGAKNSTASTKTSPSTAKNSASTAKNSPSPAQALKKSAGNAATGKKASSNSASAKGNSKNKYAFTDNDLKKIMVDSLKDIYYAEKQLHKALGKMAKVAYNPMLQDAFLTHQSETEQQIQKVEAVFGMLGEKVKAVKCPAMDGLLKEANEHIDEYSKGPGRDACLIEGAQKVEHYEIAAYGTMRTFAEVLGLNEVASALQSILDEEGATDKKLTELATTINQEALRAHREGGSED